MNNQQEIYIDDKAYIIDEHGTIRILNKAKDILGNTYFSQFFALNKPGKYSSSPIQSHASLGYYDDGNEQIYQALYKLIIDYTSVKFHNNLDKVLKDE